MVITWLGLNSTVRAAVESITAPIENYDMRPTLTLSRIWTATLAIVLLGTVGIWMVFSPDSSFRMPAIFSLILVTGLTAAFFSMFYVRRIRLERFSHREALSPGEIYARYFHDSGLQEAIVVRVWHEAAKVLALPAEKLRPTDCFDQELRPLSEWHFYDDHVDHLFAWATKLAKQRDATISLAEVRTLGDFVILMSKLQT